MEDNIHDYPIDGVLDLHMFQPREVKSVLNEYLHECRTRDILQVRIIHGKGKGVLRDIVHSYLENSAEVVEYSTASDSSSWGATLVLLAPHK